MNKYVAIGISPTNLWVILSKPCSKENAELFKGSELPTETFAVVTVQQVKEHNKVLGIEYIN